MTAEGVVLVAILAGALVLFYTQWVRADLTALLVLAGLMVPWRPTEHGIRPILAPDEAFAGFGSTAVMMVVAMFVISAGLVRTGVAESLGKRLFTRCVHREPFLQAAILGAVTLSSSVVNNTTAVLVWMPVVLKLCSEHNLSPSRYLLAIAYGALLGGQWTLVGTRPNMLISDFLEARTGTGFGFFELTPIAFFVTLGCVSFYLTIGVRLLPRSNPSEGLAEAYDVTEFLTEVMVTPGSSAEGLSLQEAALKKSYGVDVIEIIRGGRHLPPSTHERFHPGDVLIVQGPSSRIARLLKAPQYTIQEELRVAEGTLRSVDLVMAEALIGRNSSLIGRTVREVDFLADYGVSMLAMARDGRGANPLRPAHVPLRFGDTLLLCGHHQTVEGLRRHPDLHLVESEPFPMLDRRHALLMPLILLGTVLATAFKVLPASTAITGAALLTVLSGCIKMREVYRTIDWMAVVVVAGLIPFAHALEKTGTTAAIAETVAAPLSGASPSVVIGVLILVAMMLTQLVENSAIAIALAPVFYDIAVRIGADPRMVLAALAISVSTSFMSPVAHEATILVMGPGRYRFRHYLRVGAGFVVVTWLVLVLLLPQLYARPAPTATPAAGQLIPLQRP